MNEEVKKIIEESTNLHITEAFLKADNVLSRPIYHNIMCSISGGSDSDIMIDMIEKIKPKGKVHYVFFDTGLEYDATKRHLDYLEEKYNITIERVRPEKTIPQAVREYGIPFKSKLISETMERLQNHGFQWEDGEYEELMKKYPNAMSGLKWWCNERKRHNQSRSMFNIEYYRMLKEFIMENPPEFKISPKCCYYTKKKTAKNYDKANNIDLKIIGVRRAEGGVRAFAYNNCFSDNSEKNKADEFRPVYYMTNQDKEDYKKMFDIRNSDCYEVWGLKRTGCVGCPFNPRLDQELEIVKEYEPKKYKACVNLFGQSYEYNKRYRKIFRETKVTRRKNGMIPGLKEMCEGKEE